MEATHFAHDPERRHLRGLNDVMRNPPSAFLVLEMRVHTPRSM